MPDLSLDSIRAYYDYNTRLFLRFGSSRQAQTILNVFKPFWRAHPIFPSMLGSMALQQCLRDGIITYCWLLLEKGQGEGP
jgi:hypothetical protein